MVLADVFLFLFSDKKTCFKKFSNFFFRFGFWAEGLGVNAQNPKFLIILIFLFPVYFSFFKTISSFVEINCCLRFDKRLTNFSFSDATLFSGSWINFLLIKYPTKIATPIPITKDNQEMGNLINFISNETVRIIIRIATTIVRISTAILACFS